LTSTLSPSTIHIYKQRNLLPFPLASLATSAEKHLLAEYDWKGQQYSPARESSTEKREKEPGATGKKKSRSK
jgi:hypothetical protein